MSWKIDLAHSHIQFSVRHMMISTVRGEFKDFSGTIDFDRKNPENTQVHVEIDASSIDTRVEDRDNHLRSADFLYVEEYPTITYESTRVELIDDENARLIGNLTIRGESREVPVEVELQGIAKSPWGQTVAGFKGEATFNRKDWDLTWNQALETGGVLVGDKVKVDIEVELIKESEEEAAEQIEAAQESA